MNGTGGQCKAIVLLKTQETKTKNTQRTSELNHLLRVIGTKTYELWGVKVYSLLFKFLVPATINL